MPQTGALVLIRRLPKRSQAQARPRRLSTERSGTLSRSRLRLGSGWRRSPCSRPSRAAVPWTSTDSRCFAGSSLLGRRRWTTRTRGPGSAGARCTNQGWRASRSTGRSKHIRTAGRLRRARRRGPTTRLIALERQGAAERGLEAQALFSHSSVQEDNAEQVGREV